MQIGNISIYKSVILGGSCGPQNFSFSLNRTDLQVLDQRLHRFGFSEELTLETLSPRLLSLAVFGNDSGTSFFSVSKVYAGVSCFIFFTCDEELASADITLRLPPNASAEQINRLREVLSALHLNCQLPTPQTLPTPIPTPPVPPVINPPVEPPPPPPPTPPVAPRDGGGTRPAPDAEVEPEVEDAAPAPAGISLGSADYNADTGRMGVTINVGGVELTDDNDIEIITSSPAIRVIGSASRQGGSGIGLVLNTTNAEPGRTYTITVKIDGNRLGSVSVTLPEESEN